MFRNRPSLASASDASFPGSTGRASLAECRTTACQASGCARGGLRGQARPSSDRPQPTIRADLKYHDRPGQWRRQPLRRGGLRLRGVPQGGRIHPGEFLVSNFNNSANTQGTGTTVVAITPRSRSGDRTRFLQLASDRPSRSCRSCAVAFVIVGNVPTTGGNIWHNRASARSRSPIVSAPWSKLCPMRAPISNLFDSPWASAVKDQGHTAQLFVLHVESGTITRINFGGREGAWPGQPQGRPYDADRLRLHGHHSREQSPGRSCFRPDEPCLERRGRGAANRRELAGSLGVIFHVHEPILDFRPGCQLRWVWGCDGLQCE